jgi:hypothetical protein
VVVEPTSDNNRPETPFFDLASGEEGGEGSDSDSKSMSSSISGEHEVEPVHKNLLEVFGPPKGPAL